MVVLLRLLLLLLLLVAVAINGDAFVNASSVVDVVAGVAIAVVAGIAIAVAAIIVARCINSVQLLVFLLLLSLLLTASRYHNHAHCGR